MVNIGDRHTNLGRRTISSEHRLIGEPSGMAIAWAVMPGRAKERSTMRMPNCARPRRRQRRQGSAGRFSRRSGDRSPRRGRISLVDGIDVDRCVVVDDVCR